MRGLPLFLLFIIFNFISQSYCSYNEDCQNAKIVHLPEINEFVFQDMSVPSNSKRLYYASAVKDGIHWQGWASSYYEIGYLLHSAFFTKTNITVEESAENYSLFNKQPEKIKSNAVFFISYSFTDIFANNGVNHSKERKGELLNVCCHISGYNKCTPKSRWFGSQPYYILEK